MPEETDQEEPENEQGADASHDPALIVRVDDAEAHINLVSLVRLSACCVDTYSDTNPFLVRDQFERSVEEACRSRAGYGGDDHQFAHGIFPVGRIPVGGRRCCWKGHGSAGRPVEHAGGLGPLHSSRIDTASCRNVQVDCDGCRGISVLRAVVGFNLILGSRVAAASYCLVYPRKKCEAVRSQGLILLNNSEP